MKVTDYIIDFIISKGVTDMFGYPGGVICHFIDSATKYPGQINTHINYHEQAAAFAACGYAQETSGIGVAFTTSGPGATNLVTGIANAYFDSIPVMFFTGQVDTYGLKGDIPVRQRGFQETDVISMVSTITKYAVRVDDPKRIKYELAKAYSIAISGNPGPVVIDLPADVQRADINIDDCLEYSKDEADNTNYDAIIEQLQSAICSSNRPCIIAGNGVKQSGCKEDFRQLVTALNIPCVFSLPAFDILSYDHPLNFGFIGANGHRYANFVLGKSDLIITLGSRMDLKQVGNNRAEFVPDAKFIRVDIDEGNLSYKVHDDEIAIHANIIPLVKKWKYSVSSVVPKEWIDICNTLKKKLVGFDDESYTKLLCTFGKAIPDKTVITADVGQSELWVAQQIRIKEKQSAHMSAGHGTMGYSLPAAIGSYYGSRQTVFSFNGDGGVQMNIQELQYLDRERIPIKVVIMNNHALGMIRGFQEANFNKNYTQTIEGKGYSVPDFKKIAYAYNLDYLLVESEDDIDDSVIQSNRPSIIEIKMPVETTLNPNFGRNGLIQDQRPYISRELFDELMAL